MRKTPKHFTILVSTLALAIGIHLYMSKDDRNEVPTELRELVTKGKKVGSLISYMSENNIPFIADSKNEELIGFIQTSRPNSPLLRGYRIYVTSKSGSITSSEIRKTTKKD